MKFSFPDEIKKMNIRISYPRPIKKHKNNKKTEEIWRKRNENKK